MMPTLRSQKSRKSPWPGRLVFFSFWLLLQGAAFFTSGAIFSALLSDEWARWASTVGVSFMVPLFLATLLAGRARQERVGSTFRGLWIIFLIVAAGVPWLLLRDSMRTTIALQGLWPTSLKLGSPPSSAPPAKLPAPALAPAPVAPVLKPVAPAPAATLDGGPSASDGGALAPATPPDLDD